jgi:Cu(I)/Ag(I) efflux system membrane protein CusA/SilA
MLVYLDHALTGRRREAEQARRPLTRRDLRAAIMAGAVERVRPKMMTVVAIMADLLPILWSTGLGSEVMQRIAVPMIGSMVSSTILTLIVIPAVYGLIKAGACPRLSICRTRRLMRRPTSRSSGLPPSSGIATSRRMRPPAVCSSDVCKVTVCIHR